MNINRNFTGTWQNPYFYSYFHIIAHHIIHCRKEIPFDCSQNWPEPRHFWTGKEPNPTLIWSGEQGEVLPLHHTASQIYLAPCNSALAMTCNGDWFYLFPPTNKLSVYVPSLAPSLWPETSLLINEIWKVLGIGPNWGESFLFGSFQLA